MSRSSELGFGGVLLGIGIGWVALNYLDVSFDVLPYLLILVGIVIVASSVLFKGKNRAMGELAGGLIGGLFLAVIFSGVFGFTDLFPFGSDIIGSGDLVTQTFDFQDFSAIEASNGFSLDVSRGDTYSISVSVDDNVENRLNVRKDGNTLKIGLDPGDYSNLNLVARITMPSLNSIEFSGGTRGEISGFTSTRDFNVDLSGGSWAIIEGSAGDLVIDASGGSHFDFSEFTVNDADVVLSGGSNGSVYVGGRLDAALSGGAHLDYYGDPELGAIETSSAATIRARAPENAEEIALEWLRIAPTFSFDGIEGSMKVDETVIAESYPVQYFITISFDCSHPGYGDRTDQILAQVITSHKAVVVVSSGVVRSAVIDEVWNEMEVLDAPVLYVTPDMFPDFAVQYILNNYVVDPETEVVSSWTEIDESGSLVGYTVIIYEAGNWVVKVEYPVVAEPIYKISVNYTGESSFSWIGSIDTQGETITEFTDLEAKEQLLLLPGEAVEIAVTYVFSNYEELSDVEKPSRWIEEGVTPEELLGAQKTVFSSDEWTVTISYSVVWKPNYIVEISYGTETVFEWMGTVHQDGTVTEVSPA